MKGLTKLILVILVLIYNSQQMPEQNKKIETFFQGCRKQLNQWVGFEQSSEVLLQQCKVYSVGEKILSLYQDLLSIGIHLNLTHVDLMREYMKKQADLKDRLNCLINKRNTDNQYFNEQKQYKHFAGFIREHPNQGKYLFVQQQDMFFEKGKKMCNFFKAFFEFYYLNILRPSQTTSTTFLRALTVRTDIFQHEDISYCVDLQTHGNLADALDNLDINNIYLKIPDAFNAIKFIKLKNKCKSEAYLTMIKNAKQRLKGIDMFKIMYHDHEPFVQIAAEKFGTTQLKLLARKFSDIIKNPDHYKKISQQQL